MKIVLQRVKSASVRVGGETISQIGQGVLLLVGVERRDTPEIGSGLAGKVANLRIFEDQEHRMNRSLVDLIGDGAGSPQALVVSQFTLLADVSRGRRPSFIAAAPPEVAKALLDSFADDLRRRGIEVQTGLFGEHMDVELINDGPVTIWLESAVSTSTSRAGLSTDELARSN